MIYSSIHLLTCVVSVYVKKIYVIARKVYISDKINNTSAVSSVRTRHAPQVIFTIIAITLFVLLYKFIV